MFPHFSKLDSSIRASPLETDRHTDTHCVRQDRAARKASHPNLMNMWICCFMWWRRLCRCDPLKDLEIDYPQLLDGSHVITRILKNERGRQEGPGQKSRLGDLSRGQSDGRTQAKECEESREAGKDKEADSSHSPAEGMQFCWHLFSAQWNSFWISDLQNYKRRYLCCL